jgi:hypothetical protein
MEEYILIPKKDFYRMLNVLEKVEPLVREKKVEWITQAEAMALLGCGEQTLRRLRSKGSILYKTLGSRKGIMISRKSVEAYNDANSSK